MAANRPRDVRCPGAGLHPFHDSELPHGDHGGVPPYGRAIHEAIEEQKSWESSHNKGQHALGFVSGMERDAFLGEVVFPNSAEAIGAFLDDHGGTGFSVLPREAGSGRVAWQRSDGTWHSERISKPSEEWGGPRELEPEATWTAKRLVLVEDYDPWGSSESDSTGCNSSSTTGKECGSVLVVKGSRRGDQEEEEILPPRRRRRAPQAAQAVPTTASSSSSSSAGAEPAVEARARPAKPKRLPARTAGGAAASSSTSGSSAGGKRAYEKALAEGRDPPAWTRSGRFRAAADAPAPVPAGDRRSAQAVMGPRAAWREPAEEEPAPAVAAEGGAAAASPAPPPDDLDASLPGGNVEQGCEEQCKKVPRRI